jgi:ammonium transporter, Amt family
MSQLKSLTVLALAAAGLLAIGCSSSSSSSSSTTAASSPAASATTAATSPAASSPAASSPAAAAAKPSAADCKVIKPIAASAVAKLTPLQTESKAKAAAGMRTYITSLAAAEAKLTSVGGKKVIGGFITALEKSGTESTSKATATVIAALGSLGSACS